MILLDKDKNPVSASVLVGGESADLKMKQTQPLPIMADKKAYFNGNEISSYTLTICESTDTIPKPSIIDSVTYHTFIKSNGKIETQRIDSIRYEQIMKRE